MDNMYIRDRRVSFSLISVICIAYALICMTKNGFSSAMVFIVEEGILTKSQTGIITGAFYVIYGILQIAGGIVADRFDPTKFITIGMLGAGVLNLVIYFNQSYYVMLGAWSLNAVVQFAVWPSVFKILSTMPERGFRRKSIFIATFANPFGVIINYLVAAVITRWQYNFLVSAVSMFVMTVIWVITARIGKNNLVEDDDIPVRNDIPVHTESISISKMLFASGIIFVLAVTFIRTVFDIGLKNLVPVMINESYDEVSASFATILSVIVLIAGIVGLLSAGSIYSSKFKNETTAIMVMFALAIPLICITLMIGRISYWIIIASIALIVMLMSGAGYFTTSCIAMRFNKWGKGATMSGLFNCMASLGIVVANVLFTAMADAHGWIYTIKSWVILAVVATLLSLLSVPIWKQFVKKNFDK